MTRFPALFALFIFLLGSMSQAEILPLTRDFNHAEPGESHPGGTTSQKHQQNRHSFSKPAANLSLEEELNFRVGNAIFDKLWVFSPSSTTASDGLGPLYNARSCARCHQGNGRGQSMVLTQEQTADKSPVPLFVRFSRPSDDSAGAQAELARFGVVGDPTYGRQLQIFAWPNGAPEGQFSIHYSHKLQPLKGEEAIKLRRPEIKLHGLNYGPLHPQTRAGLRLAPPMIGLGLLEAIDSADLHALADPDDINNNGISGRLNQVWDPVAGELAIGRFGWKASSPNLTHQNLSALSGDIGISSWLYPDAYGDCTTQQQECRQQPNGNSKAHNHLEASRKMTDLLGIYVRHLAVPVRYRADDPKVLQGKALFYQAGCSNCHQPAFVTASTASPKLAGQTIWPYTDLLLHDMGPELADEQGVFAASGSEWRTPPLWGLGLTNAVGGHDHYLHDGRARTLLEAILWHGGEGEAAKQAVVKMSPLQRQLLLTFLESL